MAATIKDIARKLSISTSTVSYALNGGPRSVPAEVKQRVLDTAKELNYRPNRIARSLITRRSHTIGVVPTEASVNLALTPYFQGVLNGILNTAEILSHDVIIYTRYDISKPHEFANTLLDGRADGLIFLAPRSESNAIEMVSSEIPVVVTSDEDRKVASFGCDNASGVLKAVSHLVELGHKQIAHVSGPMGMADGVERLAAFEQAMALHGLPILRDWIVDGQFTTAGGYQSGKTLLGANRRPTAVVCGNDESALGFLKAAWELGLQVPRDLSVIGFDNSPIASASYPPITTVRQPLTEIGAAAMTALVNYIDTQVRPDGILFETELVIRASTSGPKEDN